MTETEGQTDGRAIAYIICICYMLSPAENVDTNVNSTIQHPLTQESPAIAENPRDDCGRVLRFPYDQYSLIRDICTNNSTEYYQVHKS